MNYPGPTRDRIVAAARKLFADHGFHRASVRAITTRAKANLGAITYHFGSKDKLRDAVVDQLFGRMADRVSAAAASPGPAAERIAGIVRGIFAFFTDNPDAPRLMIHLLASGLVTAAAPPAPVVTHQRRTLQAITSVVEAGIAAGEFRAVKPLMVAFTIISQSVWFAIVRRQVAAISGVPVDRPEMTAAVERHITEVVTRALAPA